MPYDLHEILRYRLAIDTSRETRDRSQKIIAESQRLREILRGPFRYARRSTTENTADQPEVKNKRA